MRGNIARVIVGFVSVAVALTGCVRPSDAPPTPSVTPSPTPSLSAADFASTVTSEAVLDHLRQLEALSLEHDSFRNYDSPGYEAAARYVEGRLSEAGYETYREPVRVIIERSRTSGLSIEGEQLDHEVLSGSQQLPAEGVTSQLVVAADRFGCSAAAYPEPMAGRIALTYRDAACTFAKRSDVAHQAGAAAVIVVNQVDEKFYGTIGNTATLPTFGVSAGVGERLQSAAAAGTTVKVEFRHVANQIDTFSILAETEGGSSDEVLMVGAHLDGTNRGPGVNDNASGVATILEVAVQLAKTPAFSSSEATRVRFAWWGAEEIGLRGSSAWINDRTRAELDAIKGYLNFDMLGSSNYIIGVHDGSAPMHPTQQRPPAGSQAITEQFARWFDAVDQPWVPEVFDGRSDYQPFILKGIPVGGIATGADGTKTEAERDDFGGVVGQPHDANYHKPTDTVANINTDALAITVPAVAGVVWAMTNE